MHVYIPSSNFKNGSICVLGEHVRGVLSTKHLLEKGECGLKTFLAYMQTLTSRIRIRPMPRLRAMPMAAVAFYKDIDLSCHSQVTSDGLKSDRWCKSVSNATQFCFAIRSAHSGLCLKQMLDNATSIGGDINRGAASCRLANCNVGIDVHFDPIWLILKRILVS